MTNQSLWQRRMVAAGRCKRCGQERGPNKQYCELCRCKFNAYLRARYRRRKDGK